MKKYLGLERLKNNELLYHYTKCTAAASILKTGSLFATESSFLSDSNEKSFILHIAQEYVDTIENPSWHTLLSEQILDTKAEFQRHDIFVLSFSEAADAITLWSEFGEETGYNLAFDGRELLRDIEAEQKIYCHGRVLYSHERQLELIRTLFEKTIPEKTGSTFQDILQEGSGPVFEMYCHKLRSALNIYAMFFKQEEFQAEKEYRIVFKISAKSQIHYRIKEGFITPYIEVTAGSALPLRQITVAPKNHVDLAERGMAQFAGSLGYDVPVVLSRLKLRF